MTKAREPRCAGHKSQLFQRLIAQQGTRSKQSSSQANKYIYLCAINATNRSKLWTWNDKLKQQELPQIP